MTDFEFQISSGKLVAMGWKGRDKNTYEKNGDTVAYDGTYWTLTKKLKDITEVPGYTGTASLDAVRPSINKA